MKNKDLEGLNLIEQMNLIVLRSMGKDAWNLDIIQSDIVQDQIGDFFNSVYDYIIPTLKWWQKLISVICS
jgi:hypothetical protein